MYPFETHGKDMYFQCQTQDIHSSPKNRMCDLHGSTTTLHRDGSVGSLSRRLCRSLFSTSPKISQISVPFSTSLSSHEYSDRDYSDLDLDNDSVPDASEQPPQSSSASSPEGSGRKREIRPLENGLSAGVYKAIIVGQVGQSPIKKRLRNGWQITEFTVGTGGIHTIGTGRIHKNRMPSENEEPRYSANPFAVQWHNVSVYSAQLGDIAMKHARPGTIIYLEGNLETRILGSPITGLVRQIRETAIRGNGRLICIC
ncbi:single-stranded DNA-binding protein, mitochondrial-like isoform X2 [Tripterygium wilfordii]|uniref:single-stranded DNA-binding protein, mitochondrial-like isoform X2 n=1 Tax=Tripterygium wilfordii TaxID=458696 RepID=UPI0018F842FA|nr:single-stranded DNA-binding protein, mitochondrial-like isoform X2 [Tripterygium wilfordii]